MIGGLGSGLRPNSLEDNVLNLDETYCRIMATLDRLEVLG